MDEYFLIGGKKNSKSVASAFSPHGTKLFHELIKDLEKLNDLPFELNLLKLSIEKDGLKKDADLSCLEEVWLDYQPNEFAVPLFSERFKIIIENKLTGYEGVDWISVKVNGDNEQRIYYMLKFEKKLDVLDADKTLFRAGTDAIIRPCFSKAKISIYSIFTKPSKQNLWKIPSALYINNELKKIIQKEKMSGVSFEKVAVS